MRQPIEPGQRGRAVMPPSEVCCHLGVAGRVMDFAVTTSGHPMVQLLDGERLVSFPITLGEAGVFRTADDSLYYYPEVQP